MSNKNHPINKSNPARRNHVPHSPTLTETVTIPLKDYKNMLRVCTAFDVIVNSADKYGPSRETFGGVCKSLGISIKEEADA